MTDSRPNCETYEILISTWMDEGLDRAEQRELLDHVVRCSACRELYADARSLEGLVTLAGGAAATGERPAAGSWQAIRSRVASPAAAGRPGWVWRAAAALILGLALAFAPWPTSSPATPASQVEIVLEENRGGMSEGRFVELATEILRADRRYHFAMQEVMDRVIDNEWEGDEASSEGLTEDGKKGEGAGDESPVRV